jgi:pSer/pThr/pTyr-binding forkhead associated (FHA) protein
MTPREPLKLAKLSWSDPETGDTNEHILLEGATATIGRSSNNDICIPDRHVSRQHAVITYRDGIFMISDLESANGTFVNDQKIEDPFPLFSGDVIRLFMPTIIFSSVTEDESKSLEERGTLSTTSFHTGKGQLIITSGPQEGQTIPLLLQEVTIGRATSSATWEVGLQDPSVSRPHARLEHRGNDWILIDLGSSNGTFVNDMQVTSDIEYVLKDGDAIIFGATMVLFLAR